jgi:phage terminase large subunit-like protein
LNSICTPPSTGSWKNSLAQLPEAEQARLLKGLIRRIDTPSAEQALNALRHQWLFNARAEQWPPEGDWCVWLLLAGRGFGKTRTGAEWVRMQVQHGKARRIALVAPTAADARDVMVEGESGLLAIHPDAERPRYESSKRRLTWPNGAIATTYSADEPERLRGPQHDCAWCDELAVWRYPAAWDMLMFGLRLGTNPQCVVTTTPKRVKLIRNLLKDPQTVVTRGATYANADNLPTKFLKKLKRDYEGTRLGRQELHAELLEDVDGALWTLERIEAHRVPKKPDLKRIVVAIDPAVTSHEGSDETGIIIAGIGHDDHGYVLEDASGRYSPEAWAKKAVECYQTHQADRIIAEVNNGGDLVEATLRMVDRSVSYKAVRASRGKAVRAEPVAALYEQGRVHHIGTFSTLEDQMTQFTVDFDRGRAGYSPDRAEALVWALTELMVQAAEAVQMIEFNYMA